MEQASCYHSFLHHRILLHHIHYFEMAQAFVLEQASSVAEDLLQGDYYHLILESCYCSSLHQKNAMICLRWIKTA